MAGASAALWGTRNWTDARAGRRRAIPAARVGVRGATQCAPRTLHHAP
ncbi:hypothetical protein C7S16_7073 [Burkholderia thailandensis]|uniref:Uncharacterized protein n=1 Tax=Burkholderia thailandensis TaxID=57975 RepID=A0AAW9CLT5_BURTH|nr:hypothetical protein [Burkholderia thailandensis]MDW9251579.1 hypothetical protein [Burkholderia thailandensis]